MVGLGSIVSQGQLSAAPPAQTYNPFQFQTVMNAPTALPTQPQPWGSGNYQGASGPAAPLSDIRNNPTILFVVLFVGALLALHFLHWRKS